MGGMTALKRGHRERHNVTRMLSEVLSHRWAEQEEDSKVYEERSFWAPLGTEYRRHTKADVEFDTVTRMHGRQGEAKP